MASERARGLCRPSCWSLLTNWKPRAGLEGGDVHRVVVPPSGFLPTHSAVEQVLDFLGRVGEDCGLERAEAVVVDRDERGAGGCEKTKGLDVVAHGGGEEDGGVSVGAGG